MNICTFQSCKANICYSLKMNSVIKVPKWFNYFQKQNWNLKFSINGKEGYIFFLFSIVMEFSKSSRKQNLSVIVLKLSGMFFFGISEICVTGKCPLSSQIHIVRNREWGGNLGQELFSYQPMCLSPVSLNPALSTLFSILLFCCYTYCDLREINK